MKRTDETMLPGVYFLVQVTEVCYWMKKDKSGTLAVVNEKARVLFECNLQYHNRRPISFSRTQT